MIDPEMLQKIIESGVKQHVQSALKEKMKLWIDEELEKFAALIAKEVTVRAFHQMSHEDPTGKLNISVQIVNALKE